MADPRVQLRDPWLALILAFVLPGLGHLYQRRYLKSAIFFVCVTGLFCWGMGIAEGKAVYYRPMSGPHAGDRKEFIGYLAQAGIGLPALPAIYQHKRFQSQSNLKNGRLSEPLDAAFSGEIDVDLPGRTTATTVTGHLSVKEGRNEFDGAAMAGTFVGKTADGEDITFTLLGATKIENQIDASPERVVQMTVVDEEGRDRGSISGHVDRPFWNYLEVPLSAEIERDINTRLGTGFELAYVLAMLAGMLNLLVAYDAFEGPAYGYDLATEPQPNA